jgi:flavorubredoxin
MNNRLREKIHWVGYVDWTVRDFHGYETPHGTTYNAYLVQSDKTALIDAAKESVADKLLSNISALTAPADIDYIVCNHAEPDHAGAFPVLVKACPKAEVVCNAKGRAALEMHHDTANWKWRVVEDGESISLGPERTLEFHDTPMAHWPESMVTFIPQEKLLFSMDIFGQHFASAGRFEEEEPFDVIMQEAKTYFANILMLYGSTVTRNLNKLATLEPEIIAPSHGVIWRGKVPTILEAYRQWAEHKPEPKVLVIYDSMWKSTEKMAHAILDGAAVSGVQAKLFHIRSSNITTLATETLDAAAIAFGSSTLNATLMPQAAAVLTYLKGLKPMKKAGFAFGSYGWTKAGIKDVERYLESMKFTLLREPLTSQYVPDAEKLEECRQAGALLARRALEVTGATEEVC